MVEALRQAKPVRDRRRTTLAGSAMVRARLVPGHWEGDLIKGAFNRSSVGTLLERKTRFVVLCKVRGNGADAVLDSFGRQMKRLPAALRKSMTYDRGSEIACHPELTRRRPERCQPDLAQRCRCPHEQPAQKVIGLENTRRSHGRRNRGLQFNRCT